MKPRKLRLGDLLVQHGIITAEQLDNALAQQKQKRRRLGRILTDLGYLTETELLQFLARQLDVPFVDLHEREPDPEAVRALPETHARRLRALVLELKDATATVGMADPTDLLGYDELGRLLKRNVEIAIVREADLLAAIDRIYRNTQEIEKLAGELGDSLSSDHDELSLTARDADDAPVVRLLQTIFKDAVKGRASDIHIEPEQGALRIRQRVDGVLYEQIMNEARVAAALVLRLKLMTGLDISEKRLPQDGRFHIDMLGQSIDVRLATMPTPHGEAVVMRLLRQDGGIARFADLGMPEGVQTRLERLIRQPHGCILVTGPTGSGKSTTLYAALNELNHPEKKIITVEDPIEYRLPRLTQVQVNPRVDLTFARVLRACLRCDPDILMIGEMRDTETAQIAVRAALTGHLVFSTLHTNDAIASGLRLIDMGVEGYLTASALRGVLAQRLVRRVCESCSEPYTPDPTERTWVESVLGEASERLDLRHGTGCKQCGDTGYLGRMGVFELLESSPEMADAMRRGDHAAYARAARAQPGYEPMARGALRAAASGTTTLAEVMRVAETDDGGR